MTLRWASTIAIAFSLAALSFGCGASRPVKYYVIDAGQAPLPELPSPQASVTLLVARITAPHLYRDDRIVYGSGPVELGTYEYQRWASLPADMLQDNLISALRASGKYRSVSKLGSTVRGDYIVRGQLYAFDEVDKPTLAARFSFRIELYDPKAGATIWSESYEHDEPANGKKVTYVVEALDRNVRAGLAELTTHLGQYLAGHPAANATNR